MASTNDQKSNWISNNYDNLILKADQSDFNDLPVNKQHEYKITHDSEQSIPIVNFYIDNIYKKSLKVRIGWNILIVICIVNRFWDKYIRFRNSKIELKSFTMINQINSIITEFSYSYIMVTHHWLFSEFNIEKLKQLWQEVNLPATRYNLRYISSKRKSSTIGIMIVIGIGVYNETSFIHQYDSPIISFIHNLISLLIRYCSTIIVCSLHGPMLIEVTILISSAFNHVVRLIVKLNCKNNSTIGLDDIRRIHSKIINLTLFANSMFNCYIFFLYPTHLFKSLGIFYSIIFHPISRVQINLNAFDLFSYSTAPVFIVLTTLRLMEVHVNAHKCSEKLYELSHRVTSADNKYEIVMFLLRVDNKDIGFTFWRLALIGPNFFSSMASLVVSAIISFPTIKANT